MIKLYNSKSKTKELFNPIDPDHVRMYVCGPTVYDRAHIGNARPIVVFDLLYRLLRHEYPNITYVRNITDVDDKIIDRARAEFPTMELNDAIAEITTQTEDMFREDCKRLRTLTPTVEPRATEHIGEMIAMIQRLVDIGNAYVSNGEVFFDVQSFSGYGQLSQQELTDDVTRIVHSANKLHQQDFVLWKPSGTSEPGWDSPWGFGRPGWHIECSAMSRKYLGAHFDIHGGGIDLLFPHHENEHAQSCCANEVPAMANYWMHNEFVRINGMKMSKSLNNFYTVDDVVNGKFSDTKYRGGVIKLAIMMSHYRDALDITKERFDEATRKLTRWRMAAIGIEPSEVSPVIIQALSDDLNTHEVLLELDRLMADDLPGLVASLIFLDLDNLPEPLVDQALAERLICIQEKDWLSADQIRTNLTADGVVISDYTENGERKTKWVRI